MIFRERYIAPIRAFYNSDLIKVITGIRRCGKSVILADIHKEIKERSSNVVSLDFEDAATLAAVPNAMELLNHVDKNRPDKEQLCYVFLDEVQRVEDWAAACRTSAFATVPYSSADPIPSFCRGNSPRNCPDGMYRSGFALLCIGNCLNTQRSWDVQ